MSRDLVLHLVGPWEKIRDEPRTINDDPLLDARLLAATYGSDPRVRLSHEPPTTGFPSPYLLLLPPWAGLSAASVRRLVDTADQSRAGVVRVTNVDGAPVELWRTSALGRARWHPGEPATSVAERYGVRELTAAQAGIQDLTSVPTGMLATEGAGVVAGIRPGSWVPTSVEVAGVRSWIRATHLVLTLAARQVRRRVSSVVAGPGRRAR